MRRTDVVFLSFVGRRLLHRVHLLPAWSRGRELRVCPLCPFRLYPFGEMALERVFQKKVEKTKNAPVRKTRTSAKEM